MATYICEECGRVDSVRVLEPGSWKTETILWLLFLLPGYLYRLWRRAHRTVECAKCESEAFALDASAVPVKPLLLTCSGKLLGSSKRPGVEIVPSSFSALITRAGIDAVAVDSKLFSGTTEYRAWLPFQGSEFVQLDGGRNVKKMAIGAVAGGLLLGPLGLIAGAAMRSRKTHVVSATHGESALVFEATPAQLQMLAARGVLRA